jgi:hypothetical protein
MAHKNSGQRAYTIGQSATTLKLPQLETIQRNNAVPIRIIPTREKVEYELRFLIRAFPEDYPRLVAEFEEFVKKFD